MGFGFHWFLPSIDETPSNECGRIVAPPHNTVHAVVQAQREELLQPRGITREREVLDMPRDV